MKSEKSLKLNCIADILNSLNEQCFVIDKFSNIVFVNEEFNKLYKFTNARNTKDKFKITLGADSLTYIQINDESKPCFELNLHKSNNYKVFVLYGEKHQSKPDTVFDKQMLDFIPDILFVRDSNFNILFYNKAVDEFLKLSKKEERDKQCYKIIGRSNECNNCPARESIETGNIVKTVKYFPKFKKWFDIRVYPIKNSKNEVCQIIEHIRDITIQKESEIKFYASEEQKNRLIANVPGIVYRCKMDKYWSMLFMSQETLNITGYLAECFIDNRLKYNDIIFPEDRKYVYSEIKKSIASRQNFIIEYRIITKNKKIKHVWEKGKVVINGDETYVDGVILDITDSKNTEIELATKEEKYRLLVENQNELIIKLDKHGRITFVNETYCKVFGKTEKDLLNKSFIPLIHEDDREMMSKAMISLLSPPYTCYIEQRVLTLNGWRWLAWSDKAILNKNNEVIEIIGVGRDITEKKILELELIKAKNKAELNEKQKSNFISNAYKSIKLPIDYIILTLLSIKDVQSDPVLYRDVLKSALTINSIIDGFTNIILFNEKDISLSNEKFDINDVFLSLYDIFKNDAQRLNIKFNFDRHTEVSNIIIADKVKIQRVLLHLLLNSFKNIVEGEISFGYKNNSNKLILFVKDSSDVVSTIKLSDFSAIPEEIAHTIGGNLDQMDLILAKLYVEYLSGSIRIKEDENSRTQFYVEIPVPQFSSNNNAIHENPSVNIDLSSITVLVAEDEEINFHLIKTILTKVGATVIRASSGLEAINKVRQNKNISMVFMDIKMPGISGSEALLEIKKTNPFLPVIACTAYTQPEDLDGFNESDFDGFLPKPIKRHELFKIMNDIITK